MNLWMIAWRSIQRRGVASTLTTLSMALGVMLVVAVLSIHGVISKSFQGNSTLGYNMIVGAKGGALQLTLNTVYYLSQPIENVPYDYYLEFLPAEQRQAELKNSIAYHAQQSYQQTAHIDALTASAPGIGGLQSIGTLAAQEAMTQAQAEQLDDERRGRFSPFVDLVIPLCLGDYFGNFRVVGTTPAMFDNLVFDLDRNRKYEFAQGRNFKHFDQEHGYFEAVIGATVAREMKVKLNDEISPAHGEPGGKGHERKFTVVGILAASGTPNDRAVFINMEGFYLMEDHAKPIPKEEENDEGGDDSSDDEKKADEAQADPMHTGDAHDHEDGEIRPLPVEQREVTSMLVRTVRPIYSISMQNLINEGPVAQAVMPIQQIYRLFAIIVKPIQIVLLFLTAMICIVSGISILVSIYNSMSDRKHEIAVMRALGAGRQTVMTIILLESVMLSVGGGLLGWFAAHVLNAFASPWVEAQCGVSISFFDVAPPTNVFAIMAGLCLVAGSVILIVSWLTITWQVWKQDAVWGFAVLLFPPMVIGVAIRFWKTVKPAVLFLSSGAILLLGGVVIDLSERLGFSPIEINISPEIVLIPALILLAIVVGIFPAMSAYQTDVAKSLGK